MNQNLISKSNKRFLKQKQREHVKKLNRAPNDPYNIIKNLISTGVHVIRGDSYALGYIYFFLNNFI